MSKVVSFSELAAAVVVVLVATLLTSSEGLEIVLLAVAFVLVAAWLMSAIGVLGKRVARVMQASVIALGSGGFSLIRKQPDEQLVKAGSQKRERHPLVAALSSGGFNLIRPDQADDESRQPPEPPAPSVGVG